MFIIFKDKKLSIMKGDVIMKKFMALSCAMILAIAALAACGCDSTTTDPTESSDATEVVVEATDVTEAE